MELEKESFEKFIFDLNICSSLRISIKVCINGTIDMDRYTYCLGKLSDSKIKLIMEFLTNNVDAIDYILRRTNDSTSFILSFDKETVRFYLDSSFKLNSTSMISIEVFKNKEKNEFKIRNYKPTIFLSSKVPQFFKRVLSYTDSKTFLERNDGQNYLRFKKGTDVPFSFYESICSNRDFLEFIDRYGRIPVWFQFSETSFTFYFKIN